MQRKNNLLMPIKSTVGNVLRRSMFTRGRSNFMGTSNSKSTLASTFSSCEHFSTKNIPYAKGKRRAFAMIMAVVVMIVIASITMFTLMQTSHTVKRTADLYLYEQAELHTKSAIEYTLFEIARTGCVNNTLNFTLNTIYDINVSTRYVYTEANTNFVAPIINCAEYIGATTTGSYIQTDEQNGSVLMDIVVTVKPADTGTDTIRYTRRTIQKL